MKIDMVGVRAGRLVVEAFYDVRKQDRRWLCRCDCGGTAIRSTGVLRRAARLGIECFCWRCRVDSWMELQFVRERETAARVRETWATLGTLYSAQDQARLEGAIRAALSEEFGEPRPSVEMPPPADAWSVEDHLVALIDHIRALNAPEVPLGDRERRARAHEIELETRSMHRNWIEKRRAREREAA